MSWRAVVSDRPTHPKMRTPRSSSQRQSDIAAMTFPSSRPEPSAARRSGETSSPLLALTSHDKAPRLRSGRRRRAFALRRRLVGCLAVEALALGRHVAQQLGHLDLRPVLLGELIALRDELFYADLVD